MCENVYWSAVRAVESLVNVAAVQEPEVAERAGERIHCYLDQARTILMAVRREAIRLYGPQHSLVWQINDLIGKPQEIAKHGH